MFIVYTWPEFQLVQPKKPRYPVQEACSLPKISDNAKYLSELKRIINQPIICFEINLGLIGWKMDTFKLKYIKYVQTEQDKLHNDFA